MVGWEVTGRFVREHRDALPALERWHDMTRLAKWGSIIDARRDFPRADGVGSRTVFNIRGNHYRLIAKINYRAQVVRVTHVLTHAEYDKGGSKE